MKILFFLLALANVALFMWEYHTGVFSSATENSTKNAAGYQEQIVLLSELTSNSYNKAGQTGKPATIMGEDPTEIAATEEIAAQAGETEFLPEKSTEIVTSSLKVRKAMPSDPPIAVGQTDTSCFEAGPFTSESVYNTWEHHLRGYIKSVDRDEQAIKDYLVYFPASETMIQAKENLKMLKDKGITDLWLITQGAAQGQISLGVFNKEEKALTMINELLVKGIRAEIKTRNETKVQKFAFIKGENKAIENLELLKKTYPNVIVKQAVGAKANNCL